jgi:hypothetical protein
MEATKEKDGASAVCTPDFICIQTCSYGVADPTGKQHLLSPDASEEALGQAVLDALAYTRRLTDDEIRALRSLKNVQPRYEEWVNNLIERYRYKNRRALFRNMRHCTIYRRGGEITIHPSKHDALEGWQGIKDAIVTLPADSSAEEIGAALRLAFSRCT